MNGRALKEGGNIQILHHLDTIYFGPGQMLLFKYPLQKRKFDKLYGAVQKEADAAGVPEEEIR